MSIEVSQLTRMYGDQKAVDDISFSLNKGEIVGFLGPNGAGKSTTMKIITGYIRPDKGTAVVSGINVQQDPLSAKRKIGYLPESGSSLNRHVTSAADNTMNFTVSGYCCLR